MTRLHAFTFAAALITAGLAYADGLQIAAQSPSSEKICEADPAILKDISKLPEFLPVLDTAPTVTGTTAVQVSRQTHEPMPHRSYIKEFLMDSLPMWPSLTPRQFRLI
jgi:hypothetical protein